MKQYIYTAQEIGLDKFSDGTLRLNCEETRDPKLADVFVCPEALFKFTGKEDIENRFRYYILPAPHVFLDLSEHFTTYTINTPIFISAALPKARLAAYPNSISWPWPVEDYSDIVHVPQFRHDVTFHGWLSGLVRKVSAAACKSSPLISSDIQTYPNFFGYQSDLEQAQRKQKYKESIRHARMVLTQQSIPGVLPYRFYEAMSAGRCQLYIGHDYELPFADKIHYHDFVSFLNTDSADEADRAVKDWITRYPDNVLIEKGRRARDAWDHWLRPDRWVDLMTLAVQEKLKEIHANPRPKL